jgi:hypothetical protein
VLAGVLGAHGTEYSRIGGGFERCERRVDRVAHRRLGYCDGFRHEG